MNALRKNFIFQVSYQVLILVIPLITAPYISRVLGAEPIGIQTLTYNISNYFVYFSMLGLAKYGNRCVSESKNDKDKLNIVVSELVLIHAILSFLSTILYISFFMIWGGDKTTFYLISTIYLLGTFFDINWLFFGLEEFKLTVLRNFVVKLFSTILIFIFVKKPSDLWIYITILGSSQFLSYVFLWPYLKNKIKFVRVNIINAFRKHIKGLLLLFVPIIAVSLYTSMDKIMLGTIYSDLELGYYESSERIIVLIMAIITSLGTVVMPRLTNLLSCKNEGEVKEIIDKSNFFNCFLTCGCMFGIASIASNFIPLFYGENFEQSIVILEVLSIAIVFMSISDVTRNFYLIPNKRDNVYIISVLFGALVNFILNSLLIKNYGGVGAAIATVAAEFIVCVTQLVFSFKGIRLKYFISHLIVFLLFGTVMFIFNKYVLFFEMSYFKKVLLQILFGGSLYGVLSLLYYLIYKKFVLKKEKKAYE